MHAPKDGKACEPGACEHPTWLGEVDLCGLPVPPLFCTQCLDFPLGKQLIPHFWLRDGHVANQIQTAADQSEHCSGIKEPEGQRPDLGTYYRNEGKQKLFPLGCWVSP